MALMFRTTFSVMVILVWVLAALWFVMAVSEAALDYTVLRSCIVMPGTVESLC